MQHAVGRGDVVEPDHLAHAGYLAVESGQVVGHRAIDEQRHGAGVLEDVLDLGRRQPRVERHHDRADPGQGVHQLEIAVAVERQDGDPVAALDVQGRERAGNPGNPVDGLLPGPSPGGEGCGGPVGPGLEGAAQSLGQGEHCRNARVARSFARQGGIVVKGGHERDDAAVTGRRTAGFRPAVAGLHRRSLPLLSPAARGGAGVQDAAGLVAAEPLRRRRLLAARPALRQGLRRQHHPPLRRQPHGRAGDSPISRAPCWCSIRRITPACAAW